MVKGVLRAEIYVKSTEFRLIFRLLYVAKESIKILFLARIPGSFFHSKAKAVLTLLCRVLLCFNIIAAGIHTTIKQTDNS